MKDLSPESHPRMSGPRATLGVTRRLRRAGEDHICSKVTVTSGKVPVTPMARRKIKLQAGMSNRMSHVRGYVPLHVNAGSGYRQILNEQAKKSEKPLWHPGMCKGMNNLAGYVACRDRDDWDF